MSGCGCSQKTSCSCASAKSNSFSFSPLSWGAKNLTTSCASEFTVKPGSGIIVNDCGELSIDPDWLNTQIHGTQTNKILFWNLSASATLGGEIEVNLSGGPVNSSALLKLVSGTYAKEYTLATNAAGNIASKLIPVQGPSGNYIVTIAAAGYSSNPGALPLVVGTPATVTDCSGSVVIEPFVSYPSVGTGNQVILTLKLTNTNKNAITLNMPALVLPDGLTSTSPVAIAAEIAGDASTSVGFTLVASNLTEVDVTKVITIPSGAGSYSCGGQNYSAGGGSATLVIKKAIAAPAGLQLTGIQFDRSVYYSGQPISITLGIKNTGSATLTDVKMAPILIADGATIVATDPNVLNLPPTPIAGGTTFNLVVSTVLTSATAASGVSVNRTITIPTGAITATYNGATITNSNSLSLSYTIAGSN